MQGGMQGAYVRLRNMVGMLPVLLQFRSGRVRQAQAGSGKRRQGQVALPFSGC